jgi:membrane-bound ClpP family serine protease
VTEKYTSYVRAEFRGAAASKDRRPEVAEAMVDATLSIQDPGFQLTADSLEALAEDLEDELDKDDDIDRETQQEIRQEILDGLEELEGEKFSDKDDFLDAVAEQIGEEHLRTYKDLILKHAKSSIVAEGKLLTLTTDEALAPGIRIADYEAGNLRDMLQTVATQIVLTNDSFRELQADGLPESILTKLRDLEDEIFVRKTTFFNAVEEEIKLSQLGKYHNLIWKRAEKEFGFAEISPTQIITFELNWAEQLVRFLTSQVVSGLLMTFGFLGLFLEFRTPGFGVFGTVGMVCLGLFFWGHFLVRLAGWEELLLFLAGLILLAVEIFVIPGFGVVGVAGIVAILASLALATMGQWELITIPDISGALMRITVALVFSLIVTIVLARYLPKTSLGKRLILSDSQEHEDGYVAQIQDRSPLLGLTGTTLTPIHPSGTVVIYDKRYDVVSEGEFIDRQMTVEVIDVEGARIVVRQVDNA